MKSRKQKPVRSKNYPFCKTEAPMNPQNISLSSGRLNIALQAGNRLRLEQFGAQERPWLRGDGSALFVVTVDGQRYDASNLDLIRVDDHPAGSGVQKYTATFAGPGFELTQNLLLYQNADLVEIWPEIRCGEGSGIRVTRIDSVSLELAGGQSELLHYTADWGCEFEPVQTSLGKEPVILESRTGRSSKGMHPWFALTAADGAVLSGSVVWSGNWVFRFEALEGGGWVLSGGLHDWEFAKDLRPGETLEAPRVALAVGKDLNQVSQQYASVGRKHWYPRNKLSASLPVEWNHWWSYEDAEINEAVFRSNVDEAATMGFEVCTLDAGWFGPSDEGSFWVDYRGDWHMVNEKRFPSGIRALSDYTQSKGMHFGLWCEFESLGEKAQLANDHPEFVAKRDGERLGYVCYGSPEVQEWSFQTVSHLIRDYNCSWIKLDFNLDPGAGCNREDHGHQGGDGLLAHYHGYTAVVTRLREAFPEVIFENCSSGGLRIDLAIMRQTHMTYLSDPDYPVHDLQLFWGASTMLAPETLLHWAYSDWRGYHPHQNFKPNDPNLTQKQLDYYTRISMLGGFGLSQKLPELPQWVRDRWVYHIDVYKNQVRRFVREANLYRLTGQPRRYGEGERLCAFQYSLPDSSEHLLFAFRMPGEQTNTRIRLLDLQPDRSYTVTGFDGEPEARITGTALMTDGFDFSSLEEEESVLLRIQ
jgi:alpha-galactosidase